MTNSDCPLCSPEKERIAYEAELVFAIWDGFPVSPGHALLVPKRHVATWFDGSPAEQHELMSAIGRMKAEIEKRHDPAGYNIGINSGKAAGQTVGHLHVHVIPRYEGDVEDPRGGVRWVIPEKAIYWE
jgi:diadenosine tetraphosphate (Ap4A) HIT family hydrolase